MSLSDGGDHVVNLRQASSVSNNHLAIHRDRELAPVTVDELDVLPRFLP
jgi:hypothetical protein